ncbi:MAG TPA: LpqB family beta-propeller domain-containing protein [Actinomycetaceae bacterium]|nr:LpqB family beta-propeller domain-containing protein [Actinomycetaceae bacterium]
MRKLWVVVLAVLLVLTGCTSLPRSGAVVEAERRIPPGYGVDVLAEGPAPGASPEDIVEGFLRASAYGHADDFMVASQYLADGVLWNPLEQVRVYAADSSPTYTTSSDGGISVTVDQVATVDSVGRYRIDEESDHTSRFSLVRSSDEQWRIASLEGGLLVSDINFRQTFGVSSLHFLTQDISATVPELRWYPLQDRVTHIVAGLLDGPSGWMQVGVTTAFPPGTELGPGGVSVADGLAVIDLTNEILEANDQQLALAYAQLTATLATVAGVATIEIRTPNAVVDPPEFAVDLALPQSAPGPVLLASGQLARYSGSGLQVIPGTPDLSDRNPRDPAVPHEDVDAPRVVIADDGASLLTVPDNGSEPAVLFSGTDLVPPSTDRYGWIWTGSAADASSLVTMRGDGTENRIGASWLQGRTLSHVRVADDGARAVVVSHSGLDTFVELVGVGRDGLGRPRALGEPLQIAESLDQVLDVAWVDQTSLVVLGSQLSEGAARVYRVSIGGPITILPAVEDAVSVASNRNERSVVVATEDGYLYVRSGAGWRSVLTGIRDPVFSG